MCLCTIFQLDENYEGVAVSYGTCAKTMTRNKMSRRKVSKGDASLEAEHVPFKIWCLRIGPSSEGHPNRTQPLQNFRTKGMRKDPKGDSASV